MPKLTLLPVTEATLPLLRELALATWEPTYKDILSREQLLFMQEFIYELPALRNQIAGGQQFYLLVFGEREIGFFSVTEVSPEEKRYKLNKLYLLPEMQGQGLGRQALDLAAAMVSGQNGQVLELNVNRHNPALQFYQHCGYQIIREEDIPIGKYWMNDFVLAKILA